MAAKTSFGKELKQIVKEKEDKPMSDKEKRERYDKIWSVAEVQVRALMKIAANQKQSCIEIMATRLNAATVNIRDVMAENHVTGSGWTDEQKRLTQAEPNLLQSIHAWSVANDIVFTFQHHYSSEFIPTLHDVSLKFDWS